MNKPIVILAVIINLCCLNLVYAQDIDPSTGLAYTGVRELNVDEYSGLDIPPLSHTILEGQAFNLADNYPHDLLLVDRDMGTHTFISKEGESFHFDTQADYRASDLPGAVTVYYRPCVCSFYGSLPDIAVLEDDEREPRAYIYFYKNVASSQSPLNTALASFKKSDLARDPFVKLGLRYTKDIIMIQADNDSDSYTGAPSHYDSSENIIYINPNDLALYGDALIFHELLQAGLLNALVHDYIDFEDFEKLKNLGKTYFSNFKPSYISLDYEGTDSLLESLRILSVGKAFAVGYTYKILIKSSVASNRKVQRFLEDVASNRLVLNIDGYSDYGNGTVKLHLISNTGSKEWKNVDYFIGRFTNKSSPANRDIDNAINLIRKKIAAKSLPAILSAM